MNMNSPNQIDSVVRSVASFKELPLRDQDLFLLKRLSVVFPPGESFGPIGLASGFPANERKMAAFYLLNAPFDRIRDAGYIDTESVGVQGFEITALGFATIESNTFDDDGYVTKIIP
jgi:hypothetical protein